MVLKTIFPGCGVRASLMLFYSYGLSKSQQLNIQNCKNCIQENIFKRFPLLICLIYIDYRISKASLKPFKSEIRSFFKTIEVLFLFHSPKQTVITEELHSTKG